MWTSALLWGFFSEPQTRLSHKRAKKRNRIKVKRRFRKICSCFPTFFTSPSFRGAPPSVLSVLSAGILLLLWILGNIGNVPVVVLSGFKLQIHKMSDSVTLVYLFTSTGLQLKRLLDFMLIDSVLFVFVNQTRFLWSEERLSPKETTFFPSIRRPVVSFSVNQRFHVFGLCLHGGGPGKTTKAGKGAEMTPLCFLGISIMYGFHYVSF